MPLSKHLRTTRPTKKENSRHRAQMPEASTRYTVHAPSLEFHDKSNCAPAPDPHPSPPPPSREAAAPSNADMNKTSHSFLDKHPPRASKQEGETAPSFGFPPAIALKTGRRRGGTWGGGGGGAPPTLAGASPCAGPARNKVSSLPEAPDGSSKHKQKLLNTLAGAR